MDNTTQEIQNMETVWIWRDLNGHVGDSNGGAEEITGKYGIGDKNEAVESIINFAQAGNLAMTNTYLQKSSSKRVMYLSGGNNTQVDYLLCRRSELQNVTDCKVFPGESATKQHKPVVRKSGHKS